MEVIALALSLGLAFACAALGAYAVLPAGGVTGGRRGETIRATPQQVPSLWFRLFFPFAVQLAPSFRAIAWPSYRRSAAVELRKAGMGDVVTVDHLLAMKAITALLVPFVLSRVFEVLTNPAVFVLTSVGAFFLPDRLLADARRARERAILRALPGSVDALSLSVEAGLEFLTALQRLVERGAKGPLRDELATILNDIRLGQTRADAMKAFSSRVAIPEVSSFVSVLVQADMLGASIGPVLQAQAERMRVERFQRAEKAGAKATQKILVPLVLFIFPAVLIVILGPVILQFVYGR